MKIFIVEDDQSLVKMIGDQLQRYAYNTFVPQRFDAILAEFDEIQPDLVLMDVNLPYYDGFYWCQKIRERSLVPILFISARDGNMDQVMALEYGADDFWSNLFPMNYCWQKSKVIFGVFTVTTPKLTGPVSLKLARWFIIQKR